MRIKTKLGLSVGFLFLIITSLIVIGIKSINQLSSDTQNILVANYNTIDYSRQMLIALDEFIISGNGVEKFQTNLYRQEKNITEVGEEELTKKLAGDFEKLKTGSGDSFMYVKIRKDLTDIMLLNMQAIQRKSLIAENTAKSATKIISVTGAICFLMGFIFLLNLPGSIANPIRELSESIKEIAAKNYTKRVHFEGRNEFADLATSFNTMAEKLEEYNNSNLAKIMMEKKRIETLINNMKNPVIGLDENSKIIFINNEALKTAGLNYGETIGEKIQDIATHNDLIRTLIKDAFVSEPYSGKNVGKHIKIFADGKESYFNKDIIKIEVTPTAESVSRHIGDVILLNNVTPFKELDVAKTNFIANVSHELKTPLSSIRMSVQLIENEKIGKLNVEQRELLESIKDDADRLLKITAELLNMTQVESGNIQLSIIPSDARQILMYAVNANRTLADQKHINFEINYSEELPQVLADSEKTTWVLINLISNAIRYSYENSTIFITISSDNTHVQFSVRDTGKGIEPEYKEKIFERYFRIPYSNKEGTGLGLAISKEFIEAQGGRISVDSEFASGSTFTVTLNSVKYANR